MKIATRKLNEIKKVLLNPDVSGPRWTYFTIRNLPFFSSKEVRCDLTIIPPCRLGREFNKTFGHIHGGGERERYKVLWGKALFLLQKMKSDHSGTIQDSITPPRKTLRVEEETLRVKESARFQSDTEIEEIKLIPASAGDKITIPGKYYHESINLGQTPLVLVNWLERGTENNYRLIEEKRGFGYYVVANDGKDFKLVRNENYKEVPEAEIVECIPYSV